MNYFSPRDNRQQFTYDNRRPANYQSDRDSRFRGGFHDRRGGRSGPRGQRGGYSSAAEKTLLPPIDSVLYEAADKIDPANIDYSFYDMPATVHHAHDQEDIKPFLEFQEFMSEMPAWL